MVPSAYRAAVNKICAAYNASVRALPKSTTNSLQGLVAAVQESAAATV